MLATLCIVELTVFFVLYQANTAEQLGFQLASMIYIDGETVTVGTKGGKAYLSSHPAILSSFQSHFLYGQFIYTIQGNLSHL